MQLSGTSKYADLCGIQTPRFGTLRNPDRVSRGPQLVQFADELGFELLPFMADFYDVALETDASGVLARRLAVQILGRQNGKSLGSEIRILGEMFLWDGRLTLLTAQNRALARKMFEDIIGLIHANQFLRVQVAKIRESNGTEFIKLKSGAELRVLAPTPNAFRGYTASLIVVDEARTMESNDLMSAAQYTLRTSPSAQVWSVSNAGDEKSLVLAKWRDRGRAAAEAPGTDDAVAYQEFSVEDDADVSDPKNWARSNPALGFLFKPEVLEQELMDDPDGFATESLGIWQDTSAEPGISLPAWNDCRVEGFAPFTSGDELVFGFDQDPERNHAVLVAAGWRDDRLAVGLVEYWEQPQEVDVAERIGVWMQQSRSAKLAYDPYTGLGIALRLEAAGYASSVEKVTGAEFVTACGRLVEAVTAGTLAHDGSAGLTLEVEAAGRKAIGDDVWVLSRKHSKRSIPGALALARAVHLAQTPKGWYGVY